MTADSQDFQARLTFTAPREAVFDALTTTSGLGHWWTATVTGDGREGGELRFYFGDDVPTVMRVDAAVAGSLVEWTCLGYEHLPEWAGTTITFVLSPIDDGGTTLEFRHHGLTSRLDCYAMCRNGWEHFLPSLRSYVDTGVGDPWDSEADRTRRAARASAPAPA